MPWRSIKPAASGKFAAAEELHLQFPQRRYILYH
jgi:hypothetical protein